MHTGLTQVFVWVFVIVTYLLAYLLALIQTHTTVKQ